MYDGGRSSTVLAVMMGGAYESKEGQMQLTWRGQIPCQVCCKVQELHIRFHKEMAFPRKCNVRVRASTKKIY